MKVTQLLNNYMGNSSTLDRTRIPTTLGLLHKDFTGLLTVNLDINYKPPLDHY